MFLCISKSSRDDEIEGSASPEDGGALPQEGRAVRLVVRVGAGRLGEEDQQVDHEPAGHRQHVQQQTARL